MTQIAQNTLEKLVKALVEHPEEVVVTPIEGEGTIVFEVQVNPEDAGKIIGKKGKTINALRTIIRSSANTGTKQVIMELV